MSLHNQTQEWFEDLISSLADSAAQVSVDGYNAIRLKELEEELEYQLRMQDVHNIEATKKALWAISSQGCEDIEKFNKLLSDRASFEIKRAAGRTMYSLGNQDRKRPRFARVPGYSKTYGHGCMFCIMLASRGFAYLSAKSAGAYDHYHPDCRCTVIPSWKSDTKVEGYNPKELEKEWNKLKEEKEERAKENQQKKANKA